jgi:hypothetical protein
VGPAESRDYVSLAKALRSLQQIAKIDAEGHMQVHSLRRPRFPQLKHETVDVVGKEKTKICASDSFAKTYLTAEFFVSHSF